MRDYDYYDCVYCGGTTHHPQDINNSYCPRCHQYGDLPPMRRGPSEVELAEAKASIEESARRGRL